ncbi:MAG: hypothetical protein ABF990_03390 [Acetobacter sp.]|uniref:hypothetical protein n=1 Tax=Acetobacter sp. TaxID=440 RepID=UPI0039EA2590
MERVRQELASLHKYTWNTVTADCFNYKQTSAFRGIRVKRLLVLSCFNTFERLFIGLKAVRNMAAIYNELKLGHSAIISLT